MKKVKGPDARRYLRYRIQMACLGFFIYLLLLGAFVGVKAQHLIFSQMSLGSREAVITVLLLVFAMAFSLLFGLYLFNTIVGPIKKMEGHILKLLKNEPVPEIHLRRHDQLKKLAGLHNELAKKCTDNK